MATADTNQADERKILIKYMTLEAFVEGFNNTKVAHFRWGSQNRCSRYGTLLPVS